MKFAYSMIPNPREKLGQGELEIADELKERIIKNQIQIEADIREFKESGNFGDIFMWLETDRCLAFVYMNYRQLLDMGIYEAALAEAFSRTKLNNAWMPIWLMRFLFKLADREKLRSQGDPFLKKPMVYQAEVPIEH